MPSGEITGGTFLVSRITGTNVLYNLIWLHSLVCWIHHKQMSHLVAYSSNLCALAVSCDDCWGWQLGQSSASINRVIKFAQTKDDQRYAPAHTQTKDMLGTYWPPCWKGLLSLSLRVVSFGVSCCRASGSSNNCTTRDATIAWVSSKHAMTGTRSRGRLCDWWIVSSYNYSFS